MQRSILSIMPEHRGHSTATAHPIFIFGHGAGCGGGLYPDTLHVLVYAARDRHKSFMILIRTAVVLVLRLFRVQVAGGLEAMV